MFNFRDALAAGMVTLIVLWSAIALVTVILHLLGVD